MSIFTNLFVVVLCLSLLTHVVLFIYTLDDELNDISLSKDIGLISKAYEGQYFFQNESKLIFQKPTFNDQNVQLYCPTTIRYYLLLEFATGLKAMHTVLNFSCFDLLKRHCEPLWDWFNEFNDHKNPLYISEQVKLVHQQIIEKFDDNQDNLNILEVGFGKGYCTSTLANMLPNASFVGIDVTEKHVELATNNAEANPNICSRTHFVSGNMLMENVKNITQQQRQRPFDVVFAVESLCHIGSGKLAIRNFLRHSQKIMNYKKGRRLIIIDGFRSDSFDNAPHSHRLAMELAETGFRIQQMPSQKHWIDEALNQGFVLKKQLNLSKEALQFWKFGWRFTRLVFLYAPYVLHLFANYSTETAANILSIFTVAHALHAGTAEYAMLVFEIE